MAQQGEATSGTGVGNMTVEGRSLTPEQMAEIRTEAAKAAEGTKDGGVAQDKAPASAQGDGDKPKAGEGDTPKGTDGVKPGILYRDGKPVPDGEFVPRSRLNEELSKRDEKLRAAGIDPETLKPLPAKADVKPAEIVKGQEPWAKDLVPIPKQGDKDDKGNDKYADVAAFLEALAEAKAHNKIVETNGRAKLADDAARAEREATTAKEQDARLLHTFQTETVPAMLAKEGLTLEQFGEKIERLKALPDYPGAAAALYNFALKNSNNGAALLNAIADEAASKGGLEYLAKLGALPMERLIGELFVIDGYVRKGLTAQGDPRPAKAGGKDGLTKPDAGNTGRGVEPSPGLRGSAAAVNPATLVGEARYKWLEEQRQKEVDARMKRIQGKD